MSTLIVTQTTDYRGRTVTALDGYGRIAFEPDVDADVTAMFSSDHFANGRNFFDGISDTVTIDASQMLSGNAGEMFVELAEAGSFSAAGWTFSGWSSDERVTLVGTSGSDTITGTTQSDRIDGGNGSDTLNGGGGQDTLIGGALNDTLNGDGSNDTLIGGRNGDALNGGTGIDTASYET